MATLMDMVGNEHLLQHSGEELVKRQQNGQVVRDIVLIGCCMDSW